MVIPGNPMRKTPWQVQLFSDIDEITTYCTPKEHIAHQRLNFFLFLLRLDNVIRCLFTIVVLLYLIMFDSL